MGPNGSSPNNQCSNSQVSTIIVNPSDGNDLVFGGLGSDFKVGSGGNDLLYGNLGNDVIVGGANNDCLFGNDGGDGNDNLIGGPGADKFDCGSWKPRHSS
jgi:Ca2+-binding RTX toxin-like protein